jgi:hypothetical protein
MLLHFEKALSDHHLDGEYYLYALLACIVSRRFGTFSQRTCCVTWITEARINGPKVLGSLI